MPLLAPAMFARLLLLLVSFVLVAHAEDRPKKWATPVQSRNLENAFQLDAKLYRSAQPSRKGFQEARSLGITNVVNLRKLHSDKDEARNLGMALHHIKAEADDITEREIISALRVIRAARGPVLVHCWHGSDRTGAVCAMYRVAFNNWPKEDAVDEMVKGGFGYHKLYANIIKLIRNADIEKIQAAVFAP